MELTDAPLAKAPIQDVVDWHYGRALELHNGNKMQAARSLGINTKTLYNWIEKDKDRTAKWIDDKQTFTMKLQSNNGK